MTPEEYLKIQMLITDTKLRNTFNIFYEKALQDGDTVAQIEENKQIQEAQDSKNETLRGYTPPHVMIKKNDRIYYGEDSWTLEQIEQNQKIVDTLKEQHKTASKMITNVHIPLLKEDLPKWVTRKEDIENLIDRIGIDIKDL